MEEGREEEDEKDDDEMDEDEDDFDNDAFEERKEEYFIAGYTELLDALSTDELLEVINIARFCHETVKWQGQAFYPGE